MLLSLVSVFPKWTKQSNSSGSVGWKCWGEFIQSSDSLLGLCMVFVYSFFVSFVQSVSTTSTTFFFIFCCISTHFNPGKVWMWILWLPTPAKSPINCRSWIASPSHARPRNSFKWMRLLVMSVTRKWKRGQCRLPDDTEWLTKIHWKPSYPLDCAWKNQVGKDIWGVIRVLLFYGLQVLNKAVHCTPSQRGPAFLFSSDFSLSLKFHHLS